METQSVAKLAQLLRLSSGGTDEEPEGRTGKSSAQVDRIAVQDHLELLHSPNVSKEATHAFAREFASQYLPSLVHRFTQAEAAEVALYREALLLLLQYDCTYFLRFLREYPDEAGCIYLGFVDWIVEALQDPTTLDSFQEAKRTLSFFILLVVNMVQHLSTDFPSLPPPGSAALLRLTTRIYPSFRQTAPITEQSPSDFLGILDSLIGGEANPRKLGETFCKGSLVGVWWTCERQLKSSGPTDGSRCTQLEEGEEMMQCSRCLSVRYCSKEHQRADWKRHKKLCFKPTW